MQRITITLDDDLLQAVDAHGPPGGNRSETIRDLIRAGLRQAEAQRPPEGPCAAAIAYVYDHHRRDLPERLTKAFHDHHDLSVATLHVHLDHHNCLEVAVLKGQGAEIRRFAEAVTGERGVRHGSLLVVAPEGGHNHHGEEG
ncbi:nickel responsive regulator [Pseudoroseomonas deserti]|uniref:Putative nickel-responsive regulator n=1 Tax=Teichococcus deserti TaxID=1817963 RepID=A0A1V2H215_9PROT|nr:nickel-responsive transcriptional regulator NikR [Pseudoroseomonas deserti]ONG52309.1 nickel responsive regulator [Pseudoroseomonas deserti]